MRPLQAADSDDDLIGRGARHGAAANPSSSPDMTCFLATESELDAAADEAASSRPFAHNRKSSLVSANQPAPTPPRASRPGASTVSVADSSTLSSSSSATSLRSYSPSAIGHGLPYAHSEVPASLFAGLSGPESAVSTSSSRRNSMTASTMSYQDSSVASATAASRGEAHLQDVASSPVPQFIMPSLRVPRRRPFSDAGKSIGKLRLLVVGSDGIGKTSLIQSLAQSCEHIVHIDPFSVSRPGQMGEIYASTRAQPWWRTNTTTPSQASTTRNRRASTSDILDRNLCFVDGSVPGGNSALALRYVESRLGAILANPLDEASLHSLLSNGAESIVDAVLYMLPHTGPTSSDLAHLRALNDLTNVIPLLARADELGIEAMADAKLRLRQALDDGHIDYFSFSLPGTPGDIYAVSSATHSDNDVMDASLLMSSEYNPPLISTDLPLLAEHLFSVDGSSWLRHSAAVKCVRWRSKHLQGTSMQQTALSRRRGMMGGALSPVLTANPFAQGRCWARIEVSDWAQGLRQSLRAERFDQTPQPINVGPDALLCKSSKAVVRQQRHGDGLSRRRRSARSVDDPHQDPLGLLEFAAQVRNLINI